MGVFKPLGRTGSRRVFHAPKTSERPWRLPSEIEMGVSQLALGRKGWGDGAASSVSPIGRDPPRRLALHLETSPPTFPEGEIVLIM